jgi:hypothetical protein
MTNREPRIIYGISDDRWVEASSLHPSVKRAVLAVNVSTYEAWFYQAKTYRPDLVAKMHDVVGTRLPVVLCVSGCGRPSRGQKYGSVGLCATCYQRTLRTGASVGRAGDRPAAKGQSCTVVGCEEEQYAKRMCSLHWQRVRLWGHPGGPGRMRKNWWLAGFSADEMRACKQFVHGKRNDRPLTDEGIRLRIDYEAIIKNDPCVYCGGPAGEVEHVTPVVLGGSPEWDNLAGACRSCNASKHATPLLLYLLARNGGDGHEPGKRHRRVRSA